MRTKLLVVLIILTSITIGFLLGKYISSPTSKSLPLPSFIRTLDVYTFESLAKMPYPPGKFGLTDSISEEEKFSASIFRFEFKPNPSNTEVKVVTGQINTPEEEPKAIILMLRGYVDQTIYETGVGTRKAAQVFAENGFITIAPDFLGYGGSDAQSENIMEARFQAYTTALSLLSTLESESLISQQSKHLPIFIWGHSNGGQIALTVLEITQKEYPTVLWAPVSKPFPYSVLYYTDDSEDKGKFLRRQVADFEEHYDADLYSLHKYLDRIKAPIQLHQGGADDAVPQAWSDSLAKQLEPLKPNYFVYPSADHGMRPIWDTVVARDLAFFNLQLQTLDKPI